MRLCQCKELGIALLAVAVVSIPCKARGAEGDSKALIEIRGELKGLEQGRAQDQLVIDKLEKRVEQLEGENGQLKASNVEIKTETAQASKQIKTLEAQVDQGPAPDGFASAVEDYLGTHRFTITGAAGGDFVYDQQSGALDSLHHATQDTFFFNWEPMFLYRPTDWILFEGELEAGFGQAGTGVDLPLADFQLTLNDYMTVVAGLFDQPFGDWYENQSPMWVNRFVSAPLPFGVEPVVPPSEIGLQLRGGFQWGRLGQDFDYTIWGGNGPNFSEPVLGAVVGSPTAVAFSETNGKSFGGRFRVYPLPVDSKWGRLELGASTYNGKWRNGKWFNSWGIDFNYFVGNLQTRGEWLESYRQIPASGLNDNRKGGYIQAGYFLNGVKVPGLPDRLNQHLQRLEPLVRFSGVSQRGVAIDDIQGATGIGVGGFQVGLIPDFGLSGSPALHAPHARELALGLDYWISPSIVWQNEFDIELPRSGGVFVSSTGATTPVGSVPNDHAFLSQFTIGF